MKKILEYALIGSFLTGCATTNLETVSRPCNTIQIHNQQYEIEDLSEMYLIAAIKAGKMKAYEKEQIWNGNLITTTFITGVTNPYKQKKYLEQIIRVADTNNDKKITKEETGLLKRKILNKYSIKKDKKRSSYFYWLDKMKKNITDYNSYIKNLNVHISKKIIKEDIISLEKTIETIEKFGFRGYSKGEQNGVFLIRKKDNSFLNQLENYLGSYTGQKFLKSNNLKKENLKKIKLITHRTDNKRAIGFMENYNLYFIKLGEYKWII